MPYYCESIKYDEGSGGFQPETLDQKKKTASGGVAESLQAF
jgi:hypothetical protein